MRKFRKERIAEKAFDFFHANPDLKFADQTALNHLLLGRVRMLPEQWQTLTINLKPAALSSPVVLHYANEIPWARSTRWGLLSDTVMIWHDFNDRFVLGQQRMSLKFYYKRNERINKRVLFLLLQYSVLRRLAFLVLKLCRRAHIVPELDRYLHALGSPRLQALQQDWERLAERLVVERQNELCQ